MPDDDSRIKHGTYAGWQMENKIAKERGVSVEHCDPCRLAYNAYANEYYYNRKDELGERWKELRRASRTKKQPEPTKVAAEDGTKFEDDDDW